MIIRSEFNLWHSNGKTNNSVLCSGFECICCVVLQGMVTFDSFQSALRFFHCAPLHSNIPTCRRMFSFPSKGDVHSSKRKGKKKRERNSERGGESDTITPSCQFVCGPLSLHYPVFSLLHRSPLGSRCLVYGL